MKRYEFDETELTKKAFRVYCDSDFEFYKNGETFYTGYNSKDKPFEVGTIEDVNEFLEEFA